MKERIKIPVATSFLFILLLIFSGSLSNPLGEILYYLAFIIPIGIGLYTIRKQEASGSEKQAAIGIKLSTGGALTALPLILPIIGATADSTSWNVFALSLVVYSYPERSPQVA